MAATLKGSCSSVPMRSFGRFDLGVKGNEKGIYENVISASGYHKDVRPRNDSTKPVKVDVEYELRQISDVDQHNQILYTAGFIVAIWEDDFLKWDPASYGGTESIVVPPSKIWLPDIGIINSVDTFYQSTFFTDFRVHIYYNGTVTWAFGGNFATSCTLDLTYFPFDRQVCAIILENWAYNSYEVELHKATEHVHLDDYQSNGQWEFEDSDVKITTIYHDIYPGKPYPKVNFNLHLRRKSSYYAINIIVPCLFVIFLSLLMFWLPADSGEKVSLGVTVLLALSVFQLVIAESSPKTSDFTPVLSVYVSFEMGISAFSTLITIMTLYFHHHLPNGRVPHVVRIIFFNFLPKVLFMKSDVPETDKSNMVKPNDSTSEEQRDNKESKLSIQTVENDINRNAPMTSSNGLSDGSHAQLEEIRRLIGHIVDKLEEKSEEEEMLEEWKALARVIDRFFFVICSLVLLCMCVWLFTSNGPRKLS